MMPGCLVGHFSQALLQSRKILKISEVTVMTDVSCLRRDIPPSPNKGKQSFTTVPCWYHRVRYLNVCTASTQLLLSPWFYLST